MQRPGYYILLLYPGIILATIPVHVNTPIFGNSCEEEFETDEFYVNLNFQRFMTELVMFDIYLLPRNSYDM